MWAKCANLSARFNAGYGNISPKNCFKGGQETNCRLNNLLHAALLGGQRISLWFFQTVEYKSIEATFASHSEPHMESDIGFNLKCIPEERMADDRQFTSEIQQP
jgi:hypothetical protein